MKRTTVREFSRRTSEILRDVEESHDPLLVLRHHQPLAIVVAAGSAIGQDILLGLAGDALGLLTAAERDHLNGRARLWEPCPAAQPPAAP